MRGVDDLSASARTKVFVVYVYLVTLYSQCSPQAIGERGGDNRGENSLPGPYKLDLGVYKRRDDLQTLPQ